MPKKLNTTERVTAVAQEHDPLLLRELEIDWDIFEADFGRYLIPWRSAGVVVEVLQQQVRPSAPVRYRVQFDNGMEPVTFDAMIATKAYTLKGQPAVVRLEEKPNPRRGGAPLLHLLDIAEECDS